MPYELSPGTRILKMRRISRDSEDSSSLIRQAEALEGAVIAGRYDPVGDVEDPFLFVSGYPMGRNRDVAIYVISPDDVASKAGAALFGAVESSDEKEWTRQALQIFREVHEVGPEL